MVIRRPRTHVALVLACGLHCGPEPVDPDARPHPDGAVQGRESTRPETPPPAAIEPAPPPAEETGDTGGTGGTGGASGGPLAADSPPAEPPDPRHGAVQAGDSLSKILARVGLDAPEIHRLSTAMSTLMDPATIRVGQRYDVEVDERDNLVTFLFHRSVTEAVRVSLGDDDQYTARLEQIATEISTEEIGGTIESSLWSALTKRGHSAALVDVIVDTFAYDIDFFTATRKGDRFRIVVERHEVDGEFVRYGRVLAGEYAGASETYVVLWWQPSSKTDGRYVNAEGLGVSRTLLKTPLKYARVSSGFDPKRMHPVLHREKSHNGVDYAAPEGTPVWAAADGTIVARKLAGGAGNMVVLRHDGGLKTLYMHLSAFADGQHSGQKVAAKTVIGYVGSTGLATGPHLHFGVQKNGRYVDPATVASVRGTGVAKGDRAAFNKHLDTWRARLDAIAVE